MSTLFTYVTDRHICLQTNMTALKQLLLWLCHHFHFNPFVMQYLCQHTLTESHCFSQNPQSWLPVVHQMEHCPQPSNKFRLKFNTPKSLCSNMDQIDLSPCTPYVFEVFPREIKPNFLWNVKEISCFFLSFRFFM